MSAVTSKIGPYIIEREIGRGGMGVVYLGRDERLGRKVAIKALPEVSADSAEFVTRFEREGRVLASLSHPNVAAIYGIEDAPAPGGGAAGGARFLVMEFVEGETLAAILRRGALPVDEALAVASQIAAGLEAAHEAGVVHRDLKPGNVIISESGKAKVLDFGLAKGGAEPGTMHGSRRADPESPTASIATRGAPAHSPVTIPGRIMGSAGYLSPEQARGKSLDRRTDIFSFGCVLFECLTGKMTFGGETLSDTIAATLEREPRWELLPPNTPPRVRDLIARCLEKDQSRRLRDIGDARLELEKALAGREWTTSFIASQSSLGMPTVRRSSRRSAGWLAAGLILGAGAGVAGMLLRPAVPPAEAAVPEYFSIALPVGMEALFGAISPDGLTVAIVASPKSLDHEGAEAEPPSDRSVLYLRSLRSSSERQVPDAQSVNDVCFSPDGDWFAYVTRTSGPQPTHRLIKAPVKGDSPPVVLASGDDLIRDRSLVWLGNGHIVSSRGDSGLRIYDSADGRVIRDVPLKDVGKNASVNNLSRLGTAEWVLGTLFGYAERGFSVSAVAVNLTTGEVKTLIERGGSPVSIGGDRLYFTRGDQLLTTRFDPVTLTVSGEVRALVSGLRTSSLWDHGDLSISETGTAYYVPGSVTGAHRRIMIGKPDGTAEPWCADVRPFVAIGDLAAGGGKAVVAVGEPSGLYEMWLSQAPGTPFRRFISFPSQDVAFACFGPGSDGDSLFYGAFGRDASKNAVFIQPLSASRPTAQFSGLDWNWIVTADFPGAKGAGQGPTVMAATGNTSDVVRLSWGEDQSGPLNSEVIVRGEPFAGFPSPSPDGGLLAYIRFEQGVFTLLVSRCGAPPGRALTETPVVLASDNQELLPIGWTHGEGEGSLTLFWATPRTIEYQPLDGVKGVPNGPRRSVARTTKPHDVIPISGIADGRFLYIELGPDEVRPSTMSLVRHLPALTVLPGEVRNSKR